MMIAVAPPATATQMRPELVNLDQFWAPNDHQLRGFPHVIYIVIG